MRIFRWALMVVLLVILGTALYQTLLWFGVLGSFAVSSVKPLEEDDQEVALIEPATNIDDWGRLITAIKLIEKDWPRINPNLPALQASFKNAFPSLTAEVPEITLSFAGLPGERLQVRWYKISGEHDAASWVRKLHARSRPPLAIIGGGTSDRAVRLAHALRRTYPDGEQAAPVFLITTATAETTAHGNPLIDIYQGRSFRFSFTNQKMVEALLQFVQHRQCDPRHEWARNLWVHKPADPRQLANAVASVVGTGEFWHTWMVMRSFPHLQPYTMHAVYWEDERYSKDLFFLFEHEFKKRYPLGEFLEEGSIPYSVGGFFHPSPLEQTTVDTFIVRRTPITPHSLLVLPTQTVRMRRFLVNLRQRSPSGARNLVILNGDGIAFHAIYRDREVVWNILDLPYSLVFFAHRDPIAHDAGFVWTRDESAKPGQFPQPTTTGTHDFLLYRDVVEALLYAAYDNGRLLGDPLRVRQRLQSTSWHLPARVQKDRDKPRVSNPEVHHEPGEHRPFFDAVGNRQSQTGEHIVWIKPNFSDDRVDLTSTISVWSVRPDRNGGVWQLDEAFPAKYNQPRQEEILP